jgi:hypothetical protein
LEDEEIKLFQPMAEIAMAQYSGVPEGAKGSVLKFLYHAAVHGLMKTTDLLPLVDFEQIPGVSVSIALATLEQSLSDERVRAGLLKIAQFHSTRLFARVMRILDFPRLAALDGEFAFSFVWRLTHPFPVVPAAILPTFGLLNRLPAAVLGRLDLNIRKIFLKSYTIAKPSVVAELSLLITRLGFEPSCATLDLTGDSAALAFQYLQTPPPALLEELLSTGMIPPDALPFAFPHILPSRAAFFSLIALLELEVLEFGLDITNLYQSFDLPPDAIGLEHKWIAKSDLHALFQQIRGDFSQSAFGQLITATYQFEFQPTDICF